MYIFGGIYVIKVSLRMCRYSSILFRFVRDPIHGNVFLDFKFGHLHVCLRVKGEPLSPDLLELLDSRRWKNSRTCA